MSLLLIALDTLFKGVIFVVVYFVGRYLFLEAFNGFPSFYTETSWEMEEDDCGCKQPCYCHFYNEYK
jgi:hypothetical protein